MDYSNYVSILSSSLNLVVEYLKNNAITLLSLVAIVCIVHFAKEALFRTIRRNQKLEELELIVKLAVRLSSRYKIISELEKHYVEFLDTTTLKRYLLRISHLGEGSAKAAQPESALQRHLKDPFIKELRGMADLEPRVLPGIQWRDQATLLINTSTGYAVVTIDIEAS